MAYNKETGMYEGFIYKIINTNNNHFYIGQTRRTISERFYDHCKDYTLKKYEDYGLYKAMRKHSVENFVIKELEKYECKTEEELEKVLNGREYDLVTSAKREFGKEYVYNHSDGGDFDGCATIRVPVIQYDLSCNEINRYNTVKEAKIMTGCTSISSVINKFDQKLSSGGFIWRKETEPLTDDEKRELKIHFDTMPIRMYCCGSESLHEFKNSEEAAHYILSIMNNKKTSIELIKSRIRQCCSHSHKTAYGFIWRYLGDFDIYDKSYKNCVLAVEQRENGSGRLLNTFISVSEASVFTGIDSNTISMCCNHEKDSAGGYLWNRCGDFNIEILRNISIKPVVQLSINDNFIEKFNSAKDASFYTNINRGDIIQVCRGKNKTAGGYKWKYLFDYFEIFNKEVKYA